MCEQLVSLDGVRRLTELLVCEADPLASLGASLTVSMSAAKVSVHREREGASNSTLLLAGGAGVAWVGYDALKIGMANRHRPFSPGPVP